MWTKLLFASLYEQYGTQITLVNLLKSDIDPLTGAHQFKRQVSQLKAIRHPELISQHLLKTLTNLAEIKVVFLIQEPITISIDSYISYSGHYYSKLSFHKHLDLLILTAESMFDSPPFGVVDLTLGEEFPISGNI